METETAYANPVETLRAHYCGASEHRAYLEQDVHPDQEPESDGSGYVVSTLHATRPEMRTPTYAAVLTTSIQFGDDTDTNAAVVGGILAGIRDEVDGVLQGWLRQMRVKDLVEKLLAQRIR